MLIQKDTKRVRDFSEHQAGLRALLIQKDTKLRNGIFPYASSLRALLIQKDTKPIRELRKTL